MTQTIPPPPPAPPVAPPAGRSRPRTAPTPVERLRGALAGTPGALRVAGILAATVAVLFGALGSTALAERSSGIARARDEGAQIVRLQEVRTNLVSADAAATNAFLVGGLEPSAAREAYEDGLEVATSTLALAAADTDGDDAEALAEVNRDVARYSGLVESARANNRQGFPVGVAYLKQASALLRDEVLPTLQTVTEGSARRVDDGYDRSARAMGLLGLGLLVGLGGAAASQAILAVRTRRWISVPLATAAGVVLVATILGGGAMAFAQWKADDVRSGAYADTVALSQARIDAFDAKSAESLTLISRGSGEAFEARFQEKAGAALDELEGDDFAELRTDLDVYLTVHEEVRELDDSGDWDGAVAVATDDREIGSNSTFAAFDARSGEALASAADALGDDLGAARTALGPLRLLLLVAAVIAAALAWQGPAVRLREYR